MTFWDFLERHRQLVSGRAIVVIATVDGLNAAGAFHGLLGSDTAERWFGICVAICIAMVGGAVSGRAKETTAQVKVAEAMQTAINAVPNEPLPKSVTDFSEVKP